MISIEIYSNLTTKEGMSRKLRQIADDIDNGFWSGHGWDLDGEEE